MLNDELLEDKTELRKEDLTNPLITKVLCTKLNRLSVPRVLESVNTPSQTDNQNAGESSQEQSDKVPSDSTRG